MTTGLQTWSSSGRVVLTVTPEGRVVPGEGLQMDAAAREFLAACDVYGASREAENARLRERVAVLTEAGTHALDSLADIACVHGRAFDSNEYADWDSYCSVCAAMRPLAAALSQADDGGRS